MGLTTDEQERMGEALADAIAHAHTVAPCHGEGAHGAPPQHSHPMSKSNEHTLVLPARSLKLLLDKTHSNDIDVRHHAPQPGGNAMLEIDGLGMRVNSDEAFAFQLSCPQRARLQKLLEAVGDQPVTIRFNLTASTLEVCNILL